MDANPDAQVSVATTAGTDRRGDGRRRATAGADRIFLMGYDYHWAASAPGASAPLDRRDGDEQDLVWSLDLYEALGVPVERTILGLPLYGDDVAGRRTGARRAPDGPRASNWSPATTSTSWRDPPRRPSPTNSRAGRVVRRSRAGRWRRRPTPATARRPRAGRAIYVDSPATLTPKLALANERGLAGVGFWAIGYERGLPDYAALIKQFRAGKLD